MATFFEQAVNLRYSDLDKLADELNRVLGEHNWRNARIIFDQYVLEVTRLLTDNEIENINQNIRLHYKSQQ